MTYLITQSKVLRSSLAPRSRDNLSGLLQIKTEIRKERESRKILQGPLLAHVFDESMECEEVGSSVCRRGTRVGDSFGHPRPSVQVAIKTFLVFVSMIVCAAYAHREKSMLVGCEHGAQVCTF